MSNEVNEKHELQEVTEAPESVMYPVEPDGKYRLTPQQRQAAQLFIANEMTVKRKGVKKRTLQEIAAEIGVHRDTLYDWRKQPDFQRYIKDTSVLAVSDSVPMAVARLYELANGDQTGTSSVKAIELILTAGGLLTKKIEHTVQQGAPNDMRLASDEEIDDLVAEYGGDEEE